MKGIDISHHQGSIDFAKVKASGIDIVIIKATEGKTYTDPNFQANYEGAKAAGLLVGFYHFLRGNAPGDEVDNFLNIIKGLDFDCKLVIDAEVAEADSEQIKAFKDILVSKGYEAILYTYENFYNTKLDGSVKDIPLWIAKYSSNKPKVPSYIGWQYTSSGSVDGISGRVDMNEFTEEILLNKIVSPKPIKKIIDSKVLELQKILNKLKITDGKGNRLEEDGLLGNCTKDATKRLQSIAGIEVDASAGPQTMGVVNEILANPVTKKGTSGIVVRYVQYRVGASIDGSFGPKTEVAVKSWQIKNGLVPDGSVGPNSWSKLIG